MVEFWRRLGRWRFGRTPQSAECCQSAVDWAEAPGGLYAFEEMLRRAPSAARNLLSLSR